LHLTKPFVTPLAGPGGAPIVFAGEANDGSDASRRAIGAADCHPLLSWRFAPVHQAAAAGSRPREQARVYVSR